MSPLNADAASRPPARQQESVNHAALERILRCCICLELAEEPHRLPCLHEVGCAPCLRRAVGGQHGCPICRAPYAARDVRRDPTLCKVVALALQPPAEAGAEGKDEGSGHASALDAGVSLPTDLDEDPVASLDGCALAASGSAPSPPGDRNGFAIDDDEEQRMMGEADGDAAVPTVVLEAVALEPRAEPPPTMLDAVPVETTGLHSNAAVGRGSGCAKRRRAKEAGRQGRKKANHTVTATAPEEVAAAASAAAAAAVATCSAHGPADDSPSLASGPLRPAPPGSQASEDESPLGAGGCTAVALQKFCIFAELDAAKASLNRQMAPVAATLRGDLRDPSFIGEPDRRWHPTVVVRWQATRTRIRGPFAYGSNL